MFNPNFKCFLTTLVKWNNPFLVALANDPQVFLAKINAGQIQTAKFSYTQTGGIKTLNGRPVTKSQGRLEVRCLTQGKSFVHTHGSGEALHPFGIVQKISRRLFEVPFLGAPF